MKKIFIISLVALGAALCMSCNSRSGQRPIKNNDHNIVVKFNGKDAEIPKDGGLLLIKCTVENTVIVEPATDDDCRRILESHGKG